MGINLTALKNEVVDNPQNITGLSWSQSDQWIKDKLGEIGASNETVARTSISSNDVLKALVWSEVSGFNVTQISWINLYTYGVGIDASNANIKAMFQGIFAGCAATLANLAALALRSGSRGEKLWGEDPTIQEVHEARKLV